MGSFAVVDPISHRHIEEGDPVVAWVVCPPNTERKRRMNSAGRACDPAELFGICSLPLHGSYNGYGSLEMGPSAAVDVALACYKQPDWACLEATLFDCSKGTHGLTILHKSTFDRLTDFAARYQGSLEDQLATHMTLVDRTVRFHRSVNADNLDAAYPALENLRLIGFHLRDFYDVTDASTIETITTIPTPSISRLASEDACLEEALSGFLRSMARDREFRTMLDSNSSSRARYFDIARGIGETGLLVDAMKFLGLQMMPSCSARYSDVNVLSILGGFWQEQADSAVARIMDGEQVRLLDATQSAIEVMVKGSRKLQGQLKLTPTDDMNPTI